MTPSIGRDAARSLKKEYLRSKSERINSVHYDCGVEMHLSGAGTLHLVKGTTCIDIGAKVT